MCAVKADDALWQERCLLPFWACRGTLSFVMLTIRAHDAGWCLVRVLWLVIVFLPSARAPNPIKEGEICPGGGIMRYTAGGGGGACVHGFAFYGTSSDRQYYEDIVRLLNQTVSSLSFTHDSPNVTRREVQLEMYNDEAPVLQALKSGRVDVYVGTGTNAACTTHSSQKTVAVASVSYYGELNSRRFGGVKEWRPAGLQVANAGIFVARADNTDISTLESLKGKVLVSGLPSSHQSSQFQFREMVRAGLHPTLTPGMVVWCTKPETAINMLMNHAVDVAFIGAGILKAVSQAAFVDEKELKVINVRSDVGKKGFNVPFAVSTDLYPDLTVSAKTGTSCSLVNAITETLLNIPVNSSVLEKAMIGRFSSAMRMSDSENLLSDLDIIDRPATADNVQVDACPVYNASIEGIYASISCPVGYRKVKLSVAASSCASRGLTCPKMPSSIGVIGCTCVVCSPASEIEILAQRPGEATAEVCKKNGWCGQPEQGVDSLILISDNRQGPAFTGGLNFTWMTRGFNMQSSGVAELCTEKKCGNVTHEHRRQVQGRVEGGHPAVGAKRWGSLIWGGTSVSFPRDMEHVYVFRINLVEVRQHIVEVFANGVQIAMSPVLFNVVPRTCASDMEVADADGRCVCRESTTMLFGMNKCVPLVTVALSSAIPATAILVGLLLFFAQRRIVKADELWKIDGKEIRFRKPPEVLGKGSFGLVLKGTYRGTKVAVKRAMLGTTEFKLDYKPAASSGTGHNSDRSFNGSGQDSKMGSWEAESSSVSASAIFPSSKYSSWAMSGGCFGFSLLPSQRYKDRRKLRKLHLEFQSEIRLLSKFRHPCILPIMGVVIENGKEPMLITELLEIGSLASLIRNETVVLGADLMMPIIQDIAHGLLFLHGSTPPVVHADLKSANVLVSNSFRAKVADFGLSVKHVACGTPVSMAPELLRGGKPTQSSDVYAFGIVLYEIFSRQGPYQAEVEKGLVRQVRSSCEAGGPVKLLSGWRSCHVGGTGPTPQTLNPPNMKRLRMHHEVAKNAILVRQASSTQNP